MPRKILLFALAIALVLASTASAADKLRVGMVFDVGGKGDQSFNDSAYRGLKWATKLGIKHVEIEPGADADRETGLRMIATQGFDLIIGVGFLFTDAITAVADEFPGAKFAIVDGFVPDKPNVSSLLFREHEGSFLVGIIAALRTKADHKNALGFVGGMDIPLIRKFEAGYKAGVAHVDPAFKVLVDYAGHRSLGLCRPGQGQGIGPGPDRQGRPRDLPRLRTDRSGGLRGRQGEKHLCNRG